VKKKEAIERLAQELETRDQQAFERATEAAGKAATVTRTPRDYIALAKLHLQRATTGLAFNRAMSELDRPSVLQEKWDGVVAAPPPPMPRPPSLKLY
jgi:hypothetical protein